MVEAGPEELHELADHARAAKPLGDGQDEVGRGHAFAQAPGEAEADHFGDQHRDRLSEHRRLGLDAAHAPAKHRKPVDHGGMAVGADQRVREGNERTVGLFPAEHRLREIFEIDLVADAGPGRHHAEIVEGARPQRKKA